MRKILRNKYATYSLLILVGILLGWQFFHSPEQKTAKHEHQTTEEKGTIWTCSMHPQIRRDAPGKCPICGMDLIPLNQSGNADPAAIHLTREAAELANVVTSVVSKQKPIKDVRLYGKVQADERLLQSQVAHIPGRIEKLMVNFTGEMVHRGQNLALIYSPELVTAQQELLEAAKTKDSQPEIYDAAKEKLRQWMLSESQINKIENTGNVENNFEVLAHTSGIVINRRVNSGDHIAPGTVLFDIADLSTVWVMFDAYESDLPFLNKGDRMNFTVQAIPDKTFSGNIAFIDPVIDPTTRVSKVRVEINNNGGSLKPEMFATGIIKANLTQYKNLLVIPRSAVLWTGKRSIVYVKQPATDEPVFKMREIGLGPMLGNSYVVTEGLEDGEEIVTQGAFSVDAAAQLEGKPSMMNREVNNTSNAHNHENTENLKVEDNQTEHSTTGKTNHAVFSVAGNCEMCKERIESAAKTVRGVSSAIWDMNTKKLHLEFNPNQTNTINVQKAVAKAGHDTEKVKADNTTYANLPDCCKYRN
jgi:membrane fusion protein, copper/silver efflux system